EPATVLQEHRRQLATLLPLGESFGESAALDHVAIGIDIPEHGAIALQRAGFVVSLVELDLAKADVTTLKIHRFHLPPAHCRPPADLPARFVPMVPSPSRFHPRPPVG